jgi:hypothetical protein
MKTRRQELRSNELIKELIGLRDFVVRRWQWLAIGAAAVVLIVGIIWYQAYSRSAHRAEGLNMVLGSRDTRDPSETDRLDKLVRVATEYSDKEVVLSALYAITRTSNFELLGGMLDADAQKREKVLTEAQRAYERMAAEYSDRPDVVACGRLGLAAVAEHRGLKDEARKQYKAVIDDPRFSALTQYRGLAIKRESTLDARMEPLEIRPPLPKTQPATQAATQPGIAPTASQPDSAPAAAEAATTATRPAGSGG